MHNCYNGIGTWFYQALGGLRTDSSHPGYEHVFIDPQIPEGVEWCRIGKETPYGRIDLGWEIADGELRIDVTLPPGVTATAITPAGACRGRLDGRRLAPQSPGRRSQAAATGWSSASPRKTKGDDRKKHVRTKTSRRYEKPPPTHKRTLKTAFAYDAMNRHRNSPVAHRIGPPTRNIRFNRIPNKPIIL